ncbi:MAG TPA: hypothetical protein VGF80_14025, partial [Galbitalea sp.]
MKKPMRGNIMNQRDSTVARRSQAGALTSQECEGGQHALGAYGHDGRAVYRVTTRCDCGFYDQRNLCAGRVADMAIRTGVICAGCGTVYLDGST